MAANPTWAIRLQIEDWDSGLPLTTIRLRDKSVLIKPIGFTLVAATRGSTGITSAEAIAPSESATCFAQLNRRE
jgi:hypothetical protein